MQILFVQSKVPLPICFPGNLRQRQQPLTCSGNDLSGKTILVTGATGPTGRLICGALHARGASVRAFIRPYTYMRDRSRVNAIREICPDVRYVMGDLRDAPSVAAAVAGCHGVISASGTRNFEGTDPNRPEVVDMRGMERLVGAFVESQMEQELIQMLAGDEEELERGMDGGNVSGAVKEGVTMASRFVVVSSLGVTRPERFPQIEQMASMLSYKLMGEDAVRNSGCPFTIVRPGGLIDTPAGEAHIVVDQGDRLAGSISRADVADICVEAIFNPSATNVTFECVAKPGLGISGSFSSSAFNGLFADSNIDS